LWDAISSLLASVAALRDALTAILAEHATIAEIGPDPATAANQE
jgi:hypothetical protein